MASKTWKAWKKAYHPAHFACKRQLLASGSNKPFGGAHAASMMPLRGTLDCLDSYLDNLANAAMQDKSTYTQLVNNKNTSLKKSFEALAAAYATLAGRPAPAAITAPTSNGNRAARAIRPVNYATNG